MAWNKENKLYFTIGGFFGIGITFEGIAKFMGLQLGYLLGLIALVMYSLLPKKYAFLKSLILILGNANFTAHLSRTTRHRRVA